MPRYPPQTFHEACQFFWFLHLITHIEGNGYSQSPGRFDQYMYPYYRADVDAGRLTREWAKELLGNLWVKFLENCVWGVRHNETQSLTLSGTNAAGEDLTNELSYLCLDVTQDVATPEPLVWVRWHPGIPADFVDRCLRVLVSGVSYPLFISDTVVPDMMMALGVAREDAYEYVPIGCNELGITAKMYFHGVAGVDSIGAILRILNGDGDPRPLSERYPDFESLMAAVGREMGRPVDATYQRHQALLDIHRRYGQLPFTSAFMSGCIERARDLLVRTDYNVQCSGGVFVTNLADSLAAIKTVVYERREATLEDIRDACRANFQGWERLRARLVAAPKFGNDDEVVDEIMLRLSAMRNEAVAHLVDPRDGVPLACNHVVRSSAVPAGKRTQATPDGRLAGMPLANSIGAALAADRSGPTALLNSVAKLDPVRHWRGGYNLNLRLSPRMLNSREARRKVASMMESFFVRGGQQLQINAISSDVLRAAQRNPDEYRNLVVRVAGFTDYFVNLDPALQEEIIQRTEHDS